MSEGWLSSLQSSTGRKVLAAVALAVYAGVLSLQFFSYLGDPMVVRDRWLSVKEFWLYYVHMGFCAALLGYFCVLFVLPNSGNGFWVRVRERVIRTVEREEQRKLLLESEFEKAIEARENLLRGGKMVTLLRELRLGLVLY